MKFSLVLFLLCILSGSCAAQDICGELNAIDTSFNNAYKKVIDTDSPSAADRTYLENLYFNYRKFLADNKATGLAAIIALKMVAHYGDVLFQEKKFKEGLAEIRFGMDHFLEYIERGSAWCYVAFKGNISYTEEGVQENVDIFMRTATQLSFELNETALPQQVLIKLGERDLIGSNPQMNKAAGMILKYKISRQQIDDTCFYAAYGVLVSDYEQKSVRQAMDDLNDAIGNLHSLNGITAMKIITDPKLISYRPPMVKRYKYLNFYDYYIRLYKYLVQKNGGMLAQHDALKMFLKTFNADKNGGINVDFLNTIANGTNLSPEPIKAIIKEGDTELIQLLADFIWKHCTSKYDNVRLIYGGYLCYCHLGDKKMAKKIYKRLGQNPDSRFPKLD
jgi:hypothetical protein